MNSKTTTSLTILSVIGFLFVIVMSFSDFNMLFFIINTVITVFDVLYILYLFFIMKKKSIEEINKELLEKIGIVLLVVTIIWAIILFPYEMEISQWYVDSSGKVSSFGMYGVLFLAVLVITIFNVMRNIDIKQIDKKEKWFWNYKEKGKN